MQRSRRNSLRKDSFGNNFISKVDYLHIEVDLSESIL